MGECSSVFRELGIDGLRLLQLSRIELENMAGPMAQPLFQALEVLPRALLFDLFLYILVMDYVSMYQNICPEMRQLTNILN